MQIMLEEKSVMAVIKFDLIQYFATLMTFFVENGPKIIIFSLWEMLYL